MSGWRTAVLTTLFPLSPSPSHQLLQRLASNNYSLLDPLKARKPLPNSNSSAAVFLFSGDFSLPRTHTDTHTEGRICDSAGGLSFTAVISWVQEVKGNWQPADLCSY